MNSFLRFLPICLFVLFGTGLSVYADIDDSPSVFAYQLRITNTSNFPEYQFFVRLQEWDESAEVFRDGEAIFAAQNENVKYNDRNWSGWEPEGGHSYVYAKHTKTGEISVSDELVGGALMLENQYARAIEEIRITEVKDGRVKFESKGVFKEDYDGMLKIPYKGDLGLGGLLWFYLTLPVVCLGLLIGYFVQRRKAALKKAPVS